MCRMIMVGLLYTRPVTVIQGAFLGCIIYSIRTRNYLRLQDACNTHIHNMVSNPSIELGFEHKRKARAFVATEQHCSRLRMGGRPVRRNHRVRCDRRSIETG